MKCFTHRTQDAVGACRACGKGVCPECAVDHGYGLSCRGPCEAEVVATRDQLLTARKMMVAQGKLMSAQKSNRYLAPVFFSAMGLLFFLAFAWDSHTTLFFSGIGVLFVLFGLAIFLANRRWLKGSPKDGA